MDACGEPPLKRIRELAQADKGRADALFSVLGSVQLLTGFGCIQVEALDLCRTQDEHIKGLDK